MSLSLAFHLKSAEVEPKDFLLKRGHYVRSTFLFNLFVACAVDEREHQVILISTEFHASFLSADYMRVSFLFRVVIDQDVVQTLCRLRPFFSTRIT